jgi:hypothetical protein
MMTMARKTEAEPRSSRNETEVDRELELIARRVLNETASDSDRVNYQRLLSWRRNNIFDLPTASEIRRNRHP